MAKQSPERGGSPPAAALLPRSQAVEDLARDIYLHTVLTHTGATLEHYAAQAREMARAFYADPQALPEPAPSARAIT